MTSATPDDVCILVLAGGTREPQDCLSLLGEIVPPDCIRLSPSPVPGEGFREALRLGIDMDRPWTLCLDAGVLPCSMLKSFLADAKSLGPDIFSAQASVFDPQLDNWRPGGNFLFRTELLALALPFIPDGDAPPGIAVTRAMAIKGFCFHRTPHKIGLLSPEARMPDETATRISCPALAEIDALVAVKSGVQPTPPSGMGSLRADPEDTTQAPAAHLGLIERIWNLWAKLRVWYWLLPVLLAMKREIRPD